MHPAQNIIALKAKSESSTGCVVQIFNVTEKAKLKNVEVPEAINFWKWATNEKLAIVTNNSLYYIDISKPGDIFQKIMDRFDNLKDPST